jgi:hypothetical protein
VQNKLHICWKRALAKRKYQGSSKPLEAARIIIRKITYRETGQVLPEFVISLFLLSLVIFAIFQFASIYSSNLILTYANFMGARCASVHTNDSNRYATEAINTILISTANIPLVKVTSQVNNRDIHLETELRKHISAPLIGRVIDPIGSLVGLPMIKLKASASIPRYK